MAILAECPICHKKQAIKNKSCSCGQDLDKAKRSKRVKYWITYRLPNGKQRREISDKENPYSIEVAQAAHGKRLAQKYENPHILEKVPDQKLTFKELAEWYLGLERTRALPRYRIIKIKLEKFNSHYGDLIVNRIRLSDLENLQAKRKAEGLADATVDDEIGAVKTVINAGFNNGLIGGPTLRTFNKTKKLLKRNSNARDRILSLDEFNRIMKELRGYAKPVFATGYYTGMRLGEILGLTWNKVDLQARVIRLEASDTKDREPREVRIMDELYDILKSIPRGIHDNHVFQYRGKPLMSIKKALIEACEKAGIVYGQKAKGGFVFHDLRHTFNTNMRKAGVAESVIMAITGHSTRDMFDRYNTVDAEDARKAMEQLQGYLKFAIVDQTVDQGRFSRKDTEAN